MKHFFKLIDNLENYLCQFLLVTFVALLFAQILLRNLFSYSLPWGDELATYAFVWFAYLGAVYATKMSAHNRVTFQFKFLPRWVEKVCGLLTDLIWIGFNAVFIYMSYDFVFNRMNLFWKSQTLGVPMKYFYLILPIAFTAMTIRILQNNYLRFIKKVDIVDPESQEVEKLKNTGGDVQDTPEGGER
ncbi:TRAP transporter small permease [Halomonas sp. KAO]|uniref:TRAP transporter small permease n=1 Tax=unclassified Halomonas TaxID=2609666 RepID=UPI0018A00B08|nr:MULTISPECIES: TRAP transporter small permease [unclassified Halomonas]MBF7052904.1 TRAP transporter small permease [Halomonas sp. KAO]MDT0501552.1 TRAP transporter small permease [Halomonas sp. PAR7]MDT0511091.1 TRAP transporter small permease [Halomonas sp. LES1]MDT0592392.1 TRAP transporter small permease [Halomonas sp. PAR8]